MSHSIQRQPSRNSTRNYYYGDEKQKGHKEGGDKTKQAGMRRRTSTSSGTSISSSDLELQNRKHGAQSRDSGFRSPHKSHHDYMSSSSKRKSDKGRHDDVVSPTPSAGQRSVKTTTTIVSAGLADRPSSRATNTDKVSKPQSPIQKFTNLFKPSANKQQKSHKVK